MPEAPKWVSYAGFIVKVVIAAGAIAAVWVSIFALRTANRTLALTDRPYLAVEIESIQLHNWEKPPSDPNGRSVSFRVKNYGKSPALPTAVLVHTLVFRQPDLQEQPTPAYRDNEADHPGGLIVPDQAVTISVSGPALELSKQAYDRWQARNPRQGNLFLYGYVDHDDALGNSHRSCFAFRIVDWEPRPVYWLYVNNKAYWCST